jgi:hypothetical protein
MKKIGYWMFLQMLIGCWLLISPFAMGYEEMKGLVASNMLLGAVLVIIGVGVILFNALGCERYSGMGSQMHISQPLRKP